MFIVQHYSQLDGQQQRQSLHKQTQHGVLLIFPYACPITHEEIDQQNDRNNHYIHYKRGQKQKIVLQFERCGINETFIKG